MSNSSTERKIHLLIRSPRKWFAEVGLPKSGRDLTSKILETLINAGVARIGTDGSMFCRGRSI